MENNICPISWDSIINFLYWAYPYAIGYLCSISCGDLWIGKLMEDGYKLKQEQKEFSDKEMVIYRRSPRLVGYIERILYTSAFLYKQFAFIGIWFAFKVAGRWESAKLERDLENKFHEIGKLSNQNQENLKKNEIKGKIMINHSDYNSFTIGNGLSVIFAVIGWKLIEWFKIGFQIKPILLALVVFSSTLILVNKRLSKYLKDLRLFLANYLKRKKF